MRLIQYSCSFLSLLMECANLAGTRFCTNRFVIYGNASFKLVSNFSLSKDIKCNLSDFERQVAVVISKYEFLKIRSCRNR